MLQNLMQSYHSQRQEMIDEELFDVISAFNALNGNGG